MFFKDSLLNITFLKKNFVTLFRDCTKKYERFKVFKRKIRNQAMMVLLLLYCCYRVIFLFNEKSDCLGCLLALNQIRKIMCQ